MQPHDGKIKNKTAIINYTTHLDVFVVVTQHVPMECFARVH